MNLRALQLRLDTVLEVNTVEMIRSMFRSLFASQKLEVLDVGGCTAVPQAITTDMLARLGKTLRCLKVHSNEDAGGPCKRCVYSVTDLERLGQTVRSLHTLGLDVSFDRQWVCGPLSAAQQRSWEE